MFTLSTCNEMPWPFRPQTDKKTFIYTKDHFTSINPRKATWTWKHSAGVMKKQKGSISCEKNDIPWTADNTQLYKRHSITTWTIFYPLLTIYTLRVDNFGDATLASQDFLKKLLASRWREVYSFCGFLPTSFLVHIVIECPLTVWLLGSPCTHCWHENWALLTSQKPMKACTQKVLCCCLWAKKNSVLFNHDP